MLFVNIADEEHLNVFLQCFLRQTLKRLNMTMALAVMSGEYVNGNTHVTERVTWLTNVSATVMCCRRLDIISWHEVLYHYENLSVQIHLFQ